ncbi:autotransporter outer membrane beta-barrel domain-containing protein [Alcaligenes sp. SORT26]|uniref:autotransporter family protein n=1 Tax=Alcaligenes sp. SORT26 TaxID=2813780 RepID=UPI001A9EBBFF|nr:autotransporter outer membrane beta-barrel domain-containing protein [Alcaligenes sp. SORT26]QTB99530.1 autotransporter outer membrane beta-barrel domain-containing protein [Alcaligenes sp. SORT26]
MFALNPIMLSLLSGVALAAGTISAQAETYSQIDLTQGAAGGPNFIGPDDQVIFQGTTTGGAVILGNGHSFTANGSQISAEGERVYAIGSGQSNTSVELNNSRVTSTISNGTNSQGAAIHLSGSNATLKVKDSEISSDNRKAPTIRLGGSSTATIEGSTISGNGQYLIAQGSNSTLRLQDTVLNHRNGASTLMDMSSGSTQNWSNVQVNTAGGIASVPRDSTLNIENSVLRSFGQSVSANRDGTLNIKNSEIHIGGADLKDSSSRAATSGVGVYGGTATITDSKIFYEGANSSQILKLDQPGGTMTVKKTSIKDTGAANGNTAIGVWVVDDATIHMQDVDMEVGRAGIDMRQGLAIFERVNITTTANGVAAHGIYVQGHPAWAGTPGQDLAVFHGKDINVHTKAAGAAGIYILTNNGVGLDVAASTTNINILTEGNSAHGVHMFDGTDVGTPRLDMKGVANITTLGDGAVGVYLRENPIFNFEQLNVRTSGNNADGFRLSNASNDGTQIAKSIKNSSIISAKASALRASNVGVALDISDSNIHGRQLLTLDGTQANLGSSSLNSTRSTLAGNLKLRNGAKLDSMTLDERSAWVGGIDKDADSSVGTLNLQNSSTWLMTRSSQLDKVVNKDGYLLFQPDLSTRFKTLSVNEYEGGGHMAMSVYLEGDGSGSDRLVIGDNGKVTGNTELHILNVRGPGGQTVHGIPLVVSGTGATIANDAFTLSTQSSGYRPATHTVSANGYEYSLVSRDKDQSNNHQWYLTSSTNNPDPEVPTDPETDGHVNVSPEAPAYLAAHRVSQNLFAHTFHERELNQQGLAAGQRKIWARAQVRTDKKMGFEDYDSVDAKVNSSMFQLGGDVWGKNFEKGDFRTGLMAGVGEISAKSRNQFIDPANLNSHSTLHAKDKRTGYNVGAYATYLQDAQSRQGWFVDSSLQFTHYRGKLTSDLGELKHNNNLWQVAAETGYGWKYAPDSAVLITPKAQLLYSHLSGDEGEVQGTSYAVQRKSTTQSRIGVRVEAAPDTTTLPLRPFVELAWVHRFNDTGIYVGDSRFKASNARNAGEIQLGVDGEISKSTLVSARFIREQGSGSSYGMSGMVNLNYRW